MAARGLLTLLLAALLLLESVCSETIGAAESSDDTETWIEDEPVAELRSLVKVELPLHHRTGDHDGERRQAAAGKQAAVRRHHHLRLPSVRGFAIHGHWMPLLLHRFPHPWFKRVFSVLLARRRRPRPALPDFNMYHTVTGIRTTIRALVARHPDLLSLETMRDTETGYSAAIDVVTVDARRSKGSANGDDEEESEDEEEDGYEKEEEEEDTRGPMSRRNKGRLRVLLDFGQHAREIITSEVALRLLHILSGEAPLPEGMDHDDLDDLLDGAIIKIIPLENPNGRLHVEAGAFCERKNGREVDTNRNYDIDWGVLEPDYDPREEYPGNAPFSEPEANIVRHLVSRFRPHVWANIHSGMEALFMPYDHTRAAPPGAQGAAMMALLSEVNRRHCHGRCRVGHAAGLVGYVAHGTSSDFVYQKMGVPLAFTWEIYGDMAAKAFDCIRRNNPVTATEFKRVLDDWAPAFLTLIENARDALDTMGKPIPEE